MIKVTLKENPAKIKLSDDTFHVQSSSVTFDANIPFTGDYKYTPSQSQQIIPISGKKATSNIIIDPIPNNYGLISWNGSILTVL